MRLFLCQRKQLYIKMDRQAGEKDLAEILAKAKLGETNPLLATFFFQEDLSEEDGSYASMFFRLYQPLQDAWIYKTMRQYAPDVYEAEIEELMSYWKLLLPGPVRDTGNPEMRRQYLSIFTILSENPSNQIRLILHSDETNRQDWERYVGALKELVHSEPSPDLFLRLPEESNAKYQVRIATGSNGFRHYNVRGERSVCRHIPCKR